MSSISKKKGKIVTLVAKGVKWTTLGLAFQKIYQALIVIILARLLVPEDFGLFAIAALLINATEKIKGFGMVSALIQRKENIDEAANSLFYSSIILSSFVYLIIFAVSPYISTFFHNERAVLILRIMSLQLIVTAMSAVPRTLTIKTLDFKKFALITLAGSGITGLVSVVLATNKYGTWSLVYGSLSGTACATVCWWFFSQWRPKLRLNWNVTKEMLGFGVRLSSADLFDGAVDTCNRIFVGRFLGVVSLGYYDVTSRIINMPFRNIILTGNTVALPAFCQVQENPEQIREWYLKMLSYSSIIMAPIALSLILLADQFVHVIYGDKWIAIVPLLKILGLTVLILPFVYARPVYVSTGRTDVLLRFTMLRFFITVPILFFAARISLLAVCFIELIAICFFAIINLLFVVRVLGISINQLINAIRTPIMGTVILCAAIIIFRFLTSRFFAEPNLISLLIIVIAAVTLYFYQLYLYNPEKFTEVRNLVGMSINQSE